MVLQSTLYEKNRVFADSRGGPNHAGNMAKVCYGYKKDTVDGLKINFNNNCVGRFLV